MKLQRTLKYISFGAAICSLLAWIRIATLSPATQYNISIYSSIPLDFWVLAASGSLLGEISLLGYAMDEGKSKWILIAFSSVLSSAMVLMMVPIFQGYFVLGRGDVLTQYGIMKGTVETGFLPSSLFYPMDLVMGSMVSIIGNLPLGEIVVLLPALILLLFLVGTYLFARTFLRSRSKVLFITSTSSALLFGIGGLGTSGTLVFAPSVQCFCLLPLTLYILCKAAQSQRKLAFVVCLFAILTATILFHPIETLLIILILILMSHSVKVLSVSTNLRTPRIRLSAESKRTGFSHPLILISCSFLLIGFFAWYLSFPSTSFFIRSFLASLQGVSPSSLSNIYSSYFSRGNPGLLYLVKSILNVYGVLLLCFVMGTLFTIKYARSSSQQLTSPSDKSIRLFLVTGFWIFLLITAFSFTNQLLVGLRYSEDFVFFSMLLIGIGYADSLMKAGKRKKKWLAMTIVILLLLCSYCTTIQIYVSPLTLEVSNQITKMEYTGSEWLFGEIDRNSPIGGLGFAPTRFVSAVLGYENATVNQISIPNHFGYDQNSSLASSLESGSYIVLTKLGRDWYPQGEPELEYLWLWTPEDFNHLGNDTSVDGIFNNGGLQAYLLP